MQRNNSFLEKKFVSSGLFANFFSLSLNRIMLLKNDLIIYSFKGVTGLDLFSAPCHYPMRITNCALYKFGFKFKW